MKNNNGLLILGGIAALVFIAGRGSNGSTSSSRSAAGTAAAGGPGPAGVDDAGVEFGVNTGGLPLNYGDDSSTLINGVQGGGISNFGKDKVPVGPVLTNPINQGPVSQDGVRGGGFANDDDYVFDPFGDPNPIINSDSRSKEGGVLYNPAPGDADYFEPAPYDVVSVTQQREENPDVNPVLGFAHDGTVVPTSPVIPKPVITFAPEFDYDGEAGIYYQTYPEVEPPKPYSPPVLGFADDGTSPTPVDAPVTYSYDAEAGIYYQDSPEVEETPYVEPERLLFEYF